MDDVFSAVRLPQGSRSANKATYSIKYETANKILYLIYLRIKHIAHVCQYIFK
jgi:hypothetical protein